MLTINSHPAMQKLEESVKVAPYDVLLWHKLCQVHIMNGEEDQAIPKGLEDLPYDPSPRKGKYGETISTC